MIDISLHGGPFGGGRWRKNSLIPREITQGGTHVNGPSTVQTQNVFLFTGSNGTALYNVAGDGTNLFAGSQQPDFRKVRQEDGYVIASNAYNVAAMVCDGPYVWTAYSGLLKWDAAGNLATTLASYAAAPGGSPFQMVDAGDHLYILTSNGQYTLTKQRKSDGAIVVSKNYGILATGPTLDYNAATGKLYMAQGAGVYSVDPNTLAVTLLWNHSANIFRMATNKAGDYIYLTTNTATGLVKRKIADGSIAWTAQGSLAHYGVKIGPDDGVFVSYYDGGGSLAQNYPIRKYGPDGTVLNTYGGLMNTYNQSLLVDPVSGNLLLGHSGAHGAIKTYIRLLK